MRAWLVVLLIVAGCSQEGRPLRDWTFGATGASVQLPNDLRNYIRRGEFALRTQVPLAQERGQTLTLVIDLYRGPLQCFVDGHALDDVGDIAIGEHRFVIAATHTTRDRIELELRGTRDYFTVSAFRTVPRLVVGVHERSSELASLNRTTGTASIAVLIMVLALFATMYLLDRRREYGAAVVCGICGSPVLLKPLGLLTPLGDMASVVGDAGSLVVFIALTCLVVWMFELGRVPRGWIVALTGAFVVRLVSALVLLPSPVLWGVAAIEVAWVLYLLVLLLRVARRGEYRWDARLLLVGWLIYPFVAIGNLYLNQAYATHTFGGFNEKPMVITLLMVLLAIVIARQHAARGRALEQTTAELRFQIAERSRELAETLAQLARQPVTPGSETVIAGRYRVLRPLGAGGMGAVYEAERISDRARVALKLLHGSSDGEAVARFAREARIAAELDHPNLVPVIDVGVADGQLYLVMPIIAGSNLEEQRARFGDEAWARPLLLQIARGLAALHARGIVHRDLKPANILVADYVARIADFGVAALDAYDPLAASTLAPALTQAGEVLGTPKYMSPELGAGARDATPATDVYAFGVIAKELLGASNELLDRCTNADPAQRPTSEELVGALS